MPQFSVTPAQLAAVGARLTAAGTRLRDAAGGFSQTAEALPGACGDPEASGACQEMGAAWTDAMLQVAEAAQRLGRLVQASGELYAETDEAAMPAAAEVVGNGGDGGGAR